MDQDFFMSLMEYFSTRLKIEIVSGIILPLCPIVHSYLQYPTKYDVALYARQTGNLFTSFEENHCASHSLLMHKSISSQIKLGVTSS